MAHRNPPDSGTASLVESYPHPPGRTTLDAIAAIPEEHVWLASRKSPRTRRAYRQDVEHFMRTIGIRSVEELRSMDHRAVLAWEAYMREVELAEASTIRRQLAALSSLFKHLIKPGAADFANLNSPFAISSRSLVPSPPSLRPFVPSSLLPPFAPHLAVQRTPGALYT